MSTNKRLPNEDFEDYKKRMIAETVAERLQDQIRSGRLTNSRDFQRARRRAIEKVAKAYSKTVDETQISVKIPKRGLVATFMKKILGRK